MWLMLLICEGHNWWNGPLRRKWNSISLERKDIQKQWRARRIVRRVNWRKGCKLFWKILKMTDNSKAIKRRIRRLYNFSLKWNEERILCCFESSWNYWEEERTISVKTMIRLKIAWYLRSRSSSRNTRRTVKEIRRECKVH